MQGHLAIITLTKGLLSYSTCFYVGEQTVKNVCVCIQYMVLTLVGKSDIGAHVRSNL